MRFLGSLLFLVAKHGPTVILKYYIAMQSRISDEDESEFKGCTRSWLLALGRNVFKIDYVIEVHKFFYRNNHNIVVRQVTT